MIISPFVFLSPLSPPRVIAFVLFPLLIIPVFPRSRFQGAVQPFCLIRGDGGGARGAFLCKQRPARGKDSKVHAVLADVTSSHTVDSRSSSASSPLILFFFFRFELMRDRAHMRSLETPRAMKQLTKAVNATRQRSLIETFWKREPLVAAAGSLLLGPMFLLGGAAQI